jgi:uncharacterized protein YacL
MAEPADQTRTSTPPAVTRAPTLSAAEQSARTRATAVRIVRMTFAVLLLTVTTVYIIDTGGTGESRFTFIPGWQVPVTAAGLIGLGLILLDILTPRKRLSAIGAIVVGGIIGGLGTIFLSAIIDLFVKTYGISTANSLIDSVKILIGVGLTYLGITVVLQTQDDFRLVIPYVEFAKQLRGPRPMLLDTSALIDGRVLDLAQTGLLQTPIIVPRFVIGELQTLADSGEKLTRAKGRRGLDVVAKLQRTAGLDISVDETVVPGKAVDQMLVELARRMPAIIVTGDTGLNRVATIQGVPTLNINAIANAFKPSLLPGITLAVNVVKPGEQPGQGIGYTDDGTMIVIENAEGAVGSEVRAEVTSSMQTAAGRLIFARNTEGDAEDQGEPQSGGTEPEDQDPAGGPLGQAQGVEAGGPGSITPPVRVQPPTAPIKPGPFGPGQQRKVPNRNPRRG